MASTFKTFLNNDITTTKTLLHESIPITGTIVSGTYTTHDTAGESNIKNYAHGIFQSIYDYPFLSSSANHIFDITAGYSTASFLSSSTSTQNSKKVNIYNQMAQVLMGHGPTGQIRLFDRDGDLTGGNKLNEVFFTNFSRLLVKDEIKKGSFRMTMLTGGHPGLVNGGAPSAGGAANSTEMTLGDYGAASAYKVNSPAGEYGILYTSSVASNAESGYGLLFYQAGIAVVTASIFRYDPTTAEDSKTHATFGPPLISNQKDDRAAGAGAGYAAGNGGVFGTLSGSTIKIAAEGFRNRIQKISFNNTTELNSTIYFCRANHNEFNYSANPTYVTASKIRVKENTLDSPVSYATTIGLYSADNELLAVAKLSEPLKKTPESEFTVRVRLDY